MLLLTQVATNLVDSVASANLILTPVSAPAEINMFGMAIKGRWIMIVLGVLSVACFRILFERNHVIRKAGKGSPMFMEKIKDYIHSDGIKSVINYCRTVSTPSARMIEKGINCLGHSVNDVQAAIENTGSTEVAKLGKDLTVMATIPGGAPTLSFLDTVTGMVQALYEMVDAGSSNTDITLFSGDIYKAMITTAGGLIVGIIATFAYSYLMMLVGRVVNKMEFRAMEFMDLLNKPAQK